MPLFPAGMVALGRPKGHRLLAAIGVFAFAEYLALVLFGSLSLVNFTILSFLYGPHAVISGEISIVRGRHFIELSNGDKYEGFSYAVWIASELLAVATTVFVTRRFGKWIYARVALVRRVVARFKAAMVAKKIAR